MTISQSFLIQDGNEIVGRVIFPNASKGWLSGLESPEFGEGVVAVRYAHKGFYADFVRAEELKGFQTRIVMQQADFEQLRAQKNNQAAGVFPAVLYARPIPVSDRLYPFPDEIQGPPRPWDKTNIQVVLQSSKLEA